MQINGSILAAFICYFIVMLVVGVYFYKRSTNLSDYFLGGRKMGSWVTALSAQASDMSSWLLMGLPAAAYISGISGSWIAIGLAIGTYLNWRFVAARLRRFSAVADDAITIPQYLQNRFASKSSALRSVCAVIIFIFFLIYTASAFNAGAKLFNYVFGLDYTLAVTIGAALILAYTFLGGYMAVAWTDFFQGMLMFFAIVAVPIAAMLETPGFSFGLVSELGGAGYMSLFQSPVGTLPVAEIVSGLAWGLGYFGMPHILVRFMAIRSSSMVKKSRLIAMVWVLISLTASILVGLAGRAYLASAGVFYADAGMAEYVFIDMVVKLMPGLIAGVMLSAILAAGMSTADSQLLVTASAVSNDLYRALINKNPTDKQMMWVSRGAVLAISVLAYLLALNPNNLVMGLVSYAWAGFGASFGPVILLSLFWKRMTMKGALAGMVSGGVMVVLWENLPLLAGTGVYSLLPAFVLAMGCCVLFSRLDGEPGERVKELFDKAVSADI